VGVVGGPPVELDDVDAPLLDDVDPDDVEPDVEAPDVDVPDVAVPEVEAPDVEEPDVEAPDVDVPEVAVPEEPPLEALVPDVVPVLAPEPLLVPEAVPVLVDAVELAPVPVPLLVSPLLLDPVPVLVVSSDVEEPPEAVAVDDDVADAEAPPVDELDAVDCSPPASQTPALQVIPASGQSSLAVHSSSLHADTPCITRTKSAKRLMSMYHSRQWVGSKLSRRSHPLYRRPARSSKACFVFERSKLHVGKGLTGRCLKDHWGRADPWNETLPRPPVDRLVRPSSCVRENGAAEDTLAVRKHAGAAHKSTPRRRRSQRAKGAVAAGRAAVRSALEGLCDGVLLHDAGKVHFANAAACRLWGVQAAQMKACPVLDLLVATEHPVMSAQLQAVMEGSVSCLLRGAVILRPDGTNVDVEWRTTRMDVAGQLLTQVRARPQASRATSLLVEASLAHTSDAFLIVSASQVSGERPIVFANEAFTRLTGVPHDAAQGKSFGAAISPHLGADALERIGRALDAQEPGREELLCRRRTGETFWAELDWVPMANETGECTHFVCAMRDVTERRSLLTRVALADRMSSVGTLAAGMAHEINNPLTYVTASMDHVDAQLRALKVPSKDERALVDDMRLTLAEARQGAERIRVVVRDLMVFTGDADDREDPVDLSAALNHALRMADRALKRCAPVTRNERHSVPVWGNAARYGQAFLNVLLNAAEAMPGNPAEHQLISIMTRDNLDGTVAVEITDNGAGIPPDVLPHVFEPFFTTRSRAVSSGLGLSIAHGIITGFGGTIDIQSAPGVGTTVRMCLKSAPATSRFTHRPETAAARCRLLVVDDQPDVLRATRRMLGGGHDVEAASGGQEALAILERDREFDVILCNVSMANISGADFHGELSHRWPGLEKRIIFMSGASFCEEMSQFVHGMENLLLTKPLDAGAVMAAVSEVIHRQLGASEKR
jgi:PAS domain S-box-containing protein